MDLKQDSHSTLEGHYENTLQEVSEVRFLCTEIIGLKRKYWHFKTHNSEFIELAFTGSQSQSIKVSIIDDKI